ncbi:MAG: hypothetical protein ABF760_00860 [Zymomonas mobilis]|uniref:Lipoprotein n=1 Tax=Zymomonas mobilis TaxID=542 RepID=A0A542W2C3_ZYMMB|nr:hypothetical protein [Zymomonas mobilis]TQL17728.1 hypothetical protein FBY58_1331 [Zymomonas mobilis]
MKINRCMSALSKTVLFNCLSAGLLIGGVALSGCKDGSRDSVNATAHPDTDIALGTINDEMASESIFEQDGENSIQATSLPVN